MSVQTQIKISSSPTGRILLHVLACNRDHKYRWHMTGIAREFSVMYRSLISPAPTPAA
jgi:hypothetical protein